jgi:zinc D-Ala-D-Ala carboxypeptidase
VSLGRLIAEFAPRQGSRAKFATVAARLSPMVPGLLRVVGGCIAVAIVGCSGCGTHADGASLATPQRPRAASPAPPPAMSPSTSALATVTPGPSASSAACAPGATESCVLVPNGCATGVRTCSAGAWGTCTFNNPKSAPPCTTQCAGGALSGDDPFAAVNRWNALRRDWAPADLVTVPAAYRTIDPIEKMRAQALRHMVAMLKAQRLASAPPIYCGSPYRSFASQCQLFGQYAAEDRCSKANTYSAMAGHSEHQLGTVCDLVLSDNSLIRGGTSGDAWLRDHAFEYGYVQSYPEGTSEVTGYETEPWHFRYLGTRAALLHHTMEQTAGRAISADEFIASIACQPAAKLDELATDDPEDPASLRARP